MKWTFLNPQEEEICAKWNVGRLTGSLIAAADLDDEQIRELLNPSAVLTTSSAPCVQKCADRILQARRNQEKVFVGGDYDADGICSTAIMKRTLDILGIENGYYIPDRFREGYGLSAGTVVRAHEKGYSLIITVDNGVKAHDALKKAKELGIEVIVTDHHVIEEEVDCSLVVHPDYMEEEYAYLSGAGVALQISRTLIGEKDDLTVYAAAAAVGDVMPLWRETRRIVQAGLALLRRGIPRTFSIMIPPGTSVDENTFSFNIVPKLNSVARMNDISNVNTVVRYLLCNDEDTILRYSTQLARVNDARKELSEKETALAEAQCSDTGFEVLYDDSFHEGICGLTAGRIANKYCKPVLVMAKSGDLIKGSGRSVPGFDLYGFLSVYERKAAFGGHEQAVGISVKSADFEHFRSYVKEKFAESGYAYSEPEGLAVLVEAEDLNLDNLMDLERLSPLPKELSGYFFAVKGDAVITRKTPKMTKYSAGGEHPFDAVLYASRNIEALKKPEVMIGRPGISRYRGRLSIQMIVEDMM